MFFREKSEVIELKFQLVLIYKKEFYSDFEANLKSF